MDGLQGLRLSAADDAKALLKPPAPSAWALWLVRADVRPYAALGLAAYGALIASFLGGIHWGLAMRLPQAPARLLVWGVVPSLLAWPAVMMPPHAGLVILGVLLLLCYAVDRVLYAEQQLAHWLTLRFRLSSVAALCCFIGAAGS
jgi:hypothetical protein